MLGQIADDNPGAGGVNGGGAAKQEGASSGGAGFNGNSVESHSGIWGGAAYAYTSGGQGADQRYIGNGGDGGFGGGGAGAVGGGGGGGYSGGKAGYTGTCTSSGGGYGGSYINPNGINYVKQTSSTTGPGKVIIKKILNVKKYFLFFTNRWGIN